MAPELDWRWILRAADRLRVTAAPARDKASRLVSPKRLMQLGLAIMNEADTTSRETAVRRAADYRDGLIVALLALCPLRMRNLTMIHLRPALGSACTGWLLIYAAAETKTGRPRKHRFRKCSMTDWSDTSRRTGLCCWTWGASTAGQRQTLFGSHRSARRRWRQLFDSRSPSEQRPPLANRSTHMRSATAQPH